MTNKVKWTKEDNEKYVSTVSSIMFSIFENYMRNIDDETLLSTDGFSELCAYFDTVEEKMRGKVWEEFLDSLYNADYVTSIEQFLAIARKPS